jgi:DDE superfamily endonuclease
VKEWCIPTVGPDFVCHMEDVLDLYEEEYVPQRPVVCFDESPYQLVSERRSPQPMTPQHPRRSDSQYEREGTCNLFMCAQPLTGWRHVEVTAQRTAQDVARCWRDLVDVHFPAAETIRVVLDNLNTHTPAVLYATFPAPEARRIARKLEFHYTPKHGSWLNMAEIELSVATTQCLDRRLPTQERVAAEIAAWAAVRNAERRMITWTFTTPKARTKLARLYPDRDHSSVP